MFPDLKIYLEEEEERYMYCPEGNHDLHQIEIMEVTATDVKNRKNLWFTLTNSTGELAQFQVSMRNAKFLKKYIELIESEIMS